MNKSWIDTETEVEMSINMDKIKYLVQNPLLIKSKFPEFKSQFSTQTSTFSKFLNELTLIYTPPQNDLSIAKQTYRKVRSTKPKHFNKINHHIKPYSRIYDADRKDLVIPAEEVEKKRKSPEQAKITANDEADENVDSASKKRRMRRPPVFDKVRKQPLRLTTLEPRIYKEEKYIAFMNEAMGNKENSNSLTANKFEKILGDSNLLQDEFSRANKFAINYFRSYESRAERLKAREERQKERNLKRNDKGEIIQNPEDKNKNSYSKVMDDGDILSSIQILDSSVCLKCNKPFLKDPSNPASEVCKDCSVGYMSVGKSDRNHRIRLEGEDPHFEDDNEPYPVILLLPKEDESRVGREYQAILPPFTTDFTRDQNSTRLRRMRWKPTRLEEQVVDNFKEELAKKYPKVALLDEEICEILVRNKYQVSQALEFCDEQNREFEFYIRKSFNRKKFMFRGQFKEGGK